MHKITAKFKFYLLKIKKRKPLPGTEFFYYFWNVFFSKRLSLVRCQIYSSGSQIYSIGRQIYSTWDQNNTRGQLNKSKKI